MGQSSLLIDRVGSIIYSSFSEKSLNGIGERPIFTRKQEEKNDFSFLEVLFAGTARRTNQTNKENLQGAVP